MDFDYLDEIKIEKLPGTRRSARGKKTPGTRTRQPRSSQITLDSVKDRKLLIESLRQKGWEEEGAVPALSVDAIERLRNRIEAEKKAASAGGALIPDDTAVPSAGKEWTADAEPAGATDAGRVAAAVETAASADDGAAYGAGPVDAPMAAGNAAASPAASERVPAAAEKETVSPAAYERAPAVPSHIPAASGTDGAAEKEPAKSERPLGSRVLLRYIVRELLLYFSICFAACFVVFFVNQILVMAETVLRQRVPAHNVARLILYSLPAIVAQSAPFATLVGFLMCVGRMATDNEILILRACGLRYSAIAVPVVVMGLLISFAGFAMNDYFLPLGLLKYNRLRKQIIQSDPAVEIEANSVKRMQGTSLVIGGVNEDGSIADLVIFDKDATGRDRVIVTGRSEVNKSDEPGILMQFNMSGATVLEVDRVHTRNFDVFESQKIQLNVFDSVLLPSEGVQPREMTSFDLWKIIQVMKKDESVSHKMMNRYNLEFAKKFSLPFGSIFFALLAFPLALVFGKYDGQTLGMIFGIIISVIYWAATILGQMFGVRSGWNGFWMMWGPNFFIGLVGLLLYLALRKR